MVRLFYCIILVCFIYSGAKAQLNSVEVAVDGFTCSLCAKSVENSLRQLPFVSNVKMDLNKNIASIFFIKDRLVDIHKIAKKVYDSGYTVRYIHANCSFSDVKCSDYSIYKIGSDEYHFLDMGMNIINGTFTIVFLNKKLISKKEYPHWEVWIKEDVKRNGKNDNAYYVTLLRTLE
jgi:copper chaperone CopZ